MTHRAEDVWRALSLREAGLSATEIAPTVGIPRRTVSDWITGKIPRSRARNVVSCALCGHALHRFLELPPAYVYLLGLYLGDGSIATHPRGVYKLRLTLDAKYPAIVDEAASAMQRVIPSSKVNRRNRHGDIEVYSYSKSWPCLFPQHSEGKKHLRRIALVDWQDDLVSSSARELLRGLIHSDGCRFMNTGRKWRHPRYAFSNRSADIRRIFCSACDALELHWTTSGYQIYVSRKSDVARMDEFIGPKT